MQLRARLAPHRWPQGRKRARPPVPRS